MRPFTLFLVALSIFVQPLVAGDEPIPAFTIMVPMRDGERARKREAARSTGKRTKGPAGYQEVGCGTVSFYDAEGERLAHRQSVDAVDNLLDAVGHRVSHRQERRRVVDPLRIKHVGVE